MAIQFPDSKITEADFNTRPGGSFKGYAAKPGTGPVGQTCGKCEHLERTGYASKTYFKCALMKKIRTGGPGTDIKFRSPACSQFIPEAPCPKN